MANLQKKQSSIFSIVECKVAFQQCAHELFMLFLLDLTISCSGSQGFKLIDRILCQLKVVQGSLVQVANVITREVSRSMDDGTGM